MISSNNYDHHTNRNL